MSTGRKVRAGDEIADRQQEHGCLAWLSGHGSMLIVDSQGSGTGWCFSCTLVQPGTRPPARNTVGESVVSCVMTRNGNLHETEFVPSRFPQTRKSQKAMIFPHRGKGEQMTQGPCGCGSESLVGLIFAERAHLIGIRNGATPQHPTDECRPAKLQPQQRTRVAALFPLSRAAGLHDQPPQHLGRSLAGAREVLRNGHRDWPASRLMLPTASCWSVGNIWAPVAGLRTIKAELSNMAHVSILPRISRLRLRQSPQYEKVRAVQHRRQLYVHMPDRTCDYMIAMFCSQTSPRGLIDLGQLVWGVELHPGWC